MLVLTRKQGEEVVIGDGIRVTVVAVSGNRVKLAFTAPKETRIHRAEVSLRIQGEEAVRTAAEPIAKLVASLPHDGRFRTSPCGAVTAGSARSSVRPV